MSRRCLILALLVRANLLLLVIVHAHARAVLVVPRLSCLTIYCVQIYFVAVFIILESVEGPTGSFL